MSFYINPKRVNSKKNILEFLLFNLKHLLIKPFVLLGFKNIDYFYIHGEETGNKVFLGNNVAINDALFNVSSGNIEIGDNTILTHEVHIITGFHKFYNGKLAKLSNDKNAPKEVPVSGFDIKIGTGCFIGSRVTILKGVTIGDNVIIASNSVVTKNIPNNVFVAGIPAKIISSNI
jgi:acetyltransferase-like isoleucine patch superfamily enzyme